MRLKLNDKTASQLIDLHKASGLDCNITHFINLLIDDMHKEHFPQKEEHYANSKKASVSSLH